ncbi:MAG: Snf7 family protein [Desulfurococcales archaeon]|nr:Snf7 family protein [Desulfurococcales archaeon]
MSSLGDFGKNWSGSKKTVRNAIKDTFKEIINPSPGLRYQISNAIYKLGTHISRMDYIINKLKSRDQQLFEKVVDSYKHGDMAKAKMYASEVAEIRKVAKGVITIRFALERAKTRLETVLFIGEAYKDLGPALGAIKMIASQMANVMPDSYIDIMQTVEELHNALAMSSAGFMEMPMDEAVNEEARKILEEAQLVAQQQMKDQFPALPTGGLPGTHANTGEVGAP